MKVAALLHLAERALAVLGVACSPSQVPKANRIHTVLVAAPKDPCPRDIYSVGAPQVEAGAAMLMEMRESSCVLVSSLY